MPPLREPATRKARRARAVLGALGRLPLPLNHALGSFAGSLMFFLPIHYRSNAWVNFRQCLPELGPLRRLWLLLRTLQETVKGLTEMGWLWSRTQDQVLARVREVRGEEHLRAAERSQRPLLFCAMHLGAWEYLNLYMSSRMRCSILYRERSDPGVNNLVLDARRRFGANMIPTQLGGVRTLIRRMRLGEGIGILPDHRPRLGNGVFAPFFGQPAYTTVLVSRLARKFEPVVLFGFAERLSFGRGFRIHISPAPPEIAGEDEQVAAAAMNQAMETLIRRALSQYQWTYQRWHIQPAGRDFGYHHRPD